MKLNQAVTTIRRELQFYRALWRDHRTPNLSRWALGLALAYLVNPIDLIPDFVPLLGQLDDIIIVGGLVALARVNSAVPDRRTSLGVRASAHGFRVKLEAAG